MKKKTEDIAREALLETGLVVPVHSDRVWAGWEFLCRQVPGQEKPWLLCVEAMLRWAQENIKKREDFMIARKYLLKDDRMVFGWYLRMRVKSSPELLTKTESLVKVFKMVEPVEVFRPIQETNERRVFAQNPNNPQPRQNVVTNPSRAPTIKVVSRGVDEEGKIVEVTEMPLPHAPKDLNVPTKPKWSEEHGRMIGGGRGAKATGG